MVRWHDKNVSPSQSSQLFWLHVREETRGLLSLPCSQRTLCNIHSVTLDGPHRLLWSLRSAQTGARAALTSRCNLTACCVMPLDDRSQSQYLDGQIEGGDCQLVQKEHRRRSNKRRTLIITGRRNHFISIRLCFTASRRGGFHPVISSLSLFL